MHIKSEISKVGNCRNGIHSTLVCEEPHATFRQWNQLKINPFSGRETSKIPASIITSVKRFWRKQRNNWPDSPPPPYKLTTLLLLAVLAVPKATVTSTGRARRPAGLPGTDWSRCYEYAHYGIVHNQSDLHCTANKMELGGQTAWKWSITYKCSCFCRFHQRSNKYQG